MWSANKCGTAAPLVLILALYLRPPSSVLLSRVSFLFSAVQRLWSWQRSQKVDDFTFCWQHYGIRRQLVGVAVKNGNVGHGKECNWINLRAFWYVRLCLSAICMYCVRSLSVSVLIVRGSLCVFSTGSYGFSIRVLINISPLTILLSFTPSSLFPSMSLPVPPCSFPCSFL